MDLDFTKEMRRGRTLRALIFSRSSVEAFLDSDFMSGMSLELWKAWNLVEVPVLRLCFMLDSPDLLETKSLFVISVDLLECIFLNLFCGYVREKKRVYLIEISCLVYVSML